MSISKQIGFVFSVFLASKIFAADNFHPLYRVEGFITFHQEKTNGETLNEQTSPFNFSEDANSRWHFETESTSSFGGQSIATTEIIAYNGTDIYSVLYSPNQLDTRNGQIKVVPGNDQHPAQVATGPFPIDYSSAAKLVWLAFVGGENLDSEKKQVRFPDLMLGNPREDPMAWVCDFEYDLIQQTNGQPLIHSGTFGVNPKYVSDNPLDYPEVDVLQNKVAVGRWRIEIQEYKKLKGHPLRSAYQIDETTNLNGILIPTKFHYNLFNIFNEPFHVYYGGEVTNITFPQVADLMPALKGKINVQDRRVRFKNAKSWREDVYYELDQSRWITDTNDPRIQALLTRIPPLSTLFFEKELFGQRWNHKRGFIFYGIITVFILTTLIFLKKKRT